MIPKHGRYWSPTRDLSLRVQGQIFSLLKEIDLLHRNQGIAYAEFRVTLSYHLQDNVEWTIESETSNPLTASPPTKHSSRRRPGASCHAQKSTESKSATEK